MTWFKTTITESCILGGAFHRLCREFQRAFISAGAPSDMALFAQTLVLGDSREIYFSPGSIPYVTELVRLFDARPCTSPDVDDLTMVYGVPDSSFTSDLISTEKATLTRRRVAMAR